MATSKTSNTSTRSVRGATSMAELMAHTTANIKGFKKGENVEGVITKLTPSEILVDIGAKTEASVFEREKSILKTILSSLKLGDKVTVSILNPESDMGNPVVSLRRFIGDVSWKELEKLMKDKSVLEVLVTDSTKGGFLVETDFGKSGFLPNSHSVQSGEGLVGRKVKVTIVDLNREQNKIIFSQRQAIDPKEFEGSVKGIKSGEVVTAKITGIVPFGLFVSFRFKDKNVEGFIHGSEISWEKTENLEEKFKVGEDLQAQVIDVDKENKKVNLSLKRSTKDPFLEQSEKFVKDMKIDGIVISLSDSGVTLDLGEGMEGFIKKEKIPANTNYSLHQEVSLLISEVDKRKRRIIVTPVLTAKPIGYR